MYIKLTSTPNEETRECSKVLINTDRILGMIEGMKMDFFKRVKKDEQGYPETFSEVCTRGRSFFVMETIDEIEAIMESKQSESWITQQNV